MVYSYGGYANLITDILNQWTEMGVFAYLLPFLLIFAVVYGVLSKSEIFGKNRGVPVVIAVVVGLLSLQFDIVTNFFATIFPYTAIGLSILLVAMILLGLFYTDPDTKWVKYIWVAIACIAVIVIIFSSVNEFSFFVGGFGAAALRDLLPIIIILAIIVGAVIWMVKGSTEAHH